LAFAAEDNSAAQAQKAFQAAQARHKEQPESTEAAWHFGRVCFDLAEFATNRTERADLAQQGIAACEQALEREPDLAAAHYYLGMDLGQLARTKSLGALKLVNRMERSFNRARELDAAFDYAGPDRNLGLLYRDAPTIGSIGSRSKARQHLQRAVELAPEFPDNGLSLLEACVKWGDRAGARRQLEALEAVWPAAHAKFTGSAWTASWADWEARLQKLKKKLKDKES
jgi:tetratricopeptide (TPR) repeat protein